MLRRWIRWVVVAGLVATSSGCDDGGGGDDGPEADARVADAAGAGGAGGAGGDGGDGGDGGGGGAVDAGPVEDAAPVVDATPVTDAAPVVDAAGPDTSMGFFVTSLAGLQALSGSEDGFGGDFGGLEGADAICQSLAEDVGAGHKTWRAFLSVINGPDGGPVNAIDRIGDGPWYDANGRLVAANRAGLAGARPDGDPQSVEDLPDEHGVPISALGDAHDVVTGSTPLGRVASDRMVDTCNDWTSADPELGGRPMCGHSFPRMGRGGRPPPPGAGGTHWMSDHPLRGCGAGINLIQNGPGVGTCIGCSGGYGALYCFAVDS